MAADEMDATSLTPLETPVLKVSRPVAACSRCRNAKIKCDGKLPACSSCEKNGRAAECTSTNDQFARGKERSYVSTLETRIEKLRIKLEEAKARQPSVVSIPDDETIGPSRRTSEQVQEPLTPHTARKQKRREVSRIDELVSDFGFLSVNATARDFYGFTSAMSYARLILSACTKDELPEGTTKALPQRHVAMALIQHYLNNIFVLMPAFDEATFYASVDNVYSKDSQKAEPLDHWMVRMVLAIASASMSEQRGDQHYLEGIGHVCAALQHAEMVLHPGNISGVQALILLTEYAMLDPHHFDSWSLIGAASRAMADLGLHQDPPKGTAMQRGKLELRRKVFHCVYALDRSTSLVQTRAFSFSDDSAKVKIPFHKPSTSAPNSPQPVQATQGQTWLQSHEQALDLINLRQIQSSWYTDLFQSGRTRWEDPYTYLWDTCDKMRRWFDNLAASTSPNMRAFFELDLLYSYIYVLSPSPRVPAILPFAQKLIFEYCTRYAELMLQLISDPAYTAPLTFYDAMRVYMTGRQFLDVLQQSTDLLLNGLIPPHPEVKPTAAPPPPMPVPSLPHGETIQRFNTLRSIQCIRNIIECLARFGIRWGYMSWNQRYQNETATMMEELQQRLRELEEMNGIRRQSMWQQGSIGSVPSSNGSFSYGSPQSRISQTSAGYQPSQTGRQQSPSFGESSQISNLYQAPQQPPLMRQTPSYGESGHTNHVNPPQFPEQPKAYQQQQYPVNHGIQYAQPQPQYHHQQQQQQQQPFSFNDHTYHHTGLATMPGQQFASWTGYGGPVVQNTLDEDNANSSPTGEVSGNAPTTTSQFSPRQAHSTQGPTDRQLMPPPPVPQRPAVQPTICPPLKIPKTSILPPLSGPGSAVSLHATTTQSERRTSMNDAALDVLQSTYPATAQRTARNSVTDKGKAKAKVNPPGSTGSSKSSIHLRNTANTGAGFTFKAGIGYVCNVCGRLCPRADLHQTMPDGSGCIDYQSPLDAFAPQPSLLEMMQAQAAGHSVPQGGSFDLGLQTIPTNDSVHAQLYREGMLGSQQLEGLDYVVRAGTSDVGMVDMQGQQMNDGSMLDAQGLQMAPHGLMPYDGNALAQMTEDGTAMDLNNPDANDGSAQMQGEAVAVNDLLDWMVEAVNQQGGGLFF